MSPPATVRVQPTVEAAVKSPLPAPPAMTTRRPPVWRSASVTVTAAKGAMVPPYRKARPAWVPPMTTASLTEVVVTLVWLSTSAAATPSLTVSVKVVVSLPPGIARLAAGVKTSARSAACAWAAVPVKLHCPAAAS